MGSLLLKAAGAAVIGLMALNLISYLFVRFQTAEITQEGFEHGLFYVNQGPVGVPFGSMLGMVIMGGIFGYVIYRGLGRRRTLA
ncbi:hypothetical protein [Lewinella sp. 4G2]|uniref:hypothetical protein n=1 Tax=Lewinella sp. 4G2 TaxID=1803372 RepID=UPI0007B4E5EB|nr:hypothetical protein [Lewinella sp. 4G2]OAV46129.1 hypothetical protein A3850_017875 [Lewinella sp. 4G2]